MANAPQGLPSDFKNLSPFGNKKTTKKSGGSDTAFLAIGFIGILAALVLIFRALTLSA